VSRWRPEHCVELHIGGAGRPGAAQRVDALVAEFERQVATIEPRAFATVACVVGGDAVRCAVLAWQAELSSAAARQAVAEQVFRETYGEPARDWTVVCEPAERYGAATLACAIDSTLLDRLDAVLRPRRKTLVSLQPSLIHAFNQVRRSIDVDRFWFVLVEPQGMTLLLTTPGGPLHVMQPPNGTALGALLDREWFALGIEGDRVPVYRCAAGDVDVGVACGGTAGWRVIDLPTPAIGAAPMRPAA
jgi:hypothetical protein